MKKTLRRTAGMMMALVAAASLFGGCGRTEKEAVIQATRVQTEAASRGTLEITGTYIGTISPHNSVNVTPLVAGVVTKVNVKVGDKVKKGDVLCTFDDKAAELQLQSAQDAVNSAKAGKEAAKDQIHAAKKQAEASVTSMEGQIKTLRAQKKESEKQLKQLKEGLSTLEEGKDAAQEVYIAMKTAYDTANALFIQFQAFLVTNPDCFTTAGLIAAAIPETTPAATPAPAAPVSPAAGSTGEAAAAEPEAETVIDEALIARQETAAALLDALNENELAVEYLTPAGLKTLKEQMEQAQSAFEQAAAGYSQAAGSITQLESGIKQIKAQISALEDNIDAAEDAANSGGGTKAYDAQIRAAETGVESAQYQKDLYTVTAPISGVIETVNVSENEISAQGYPAFTISDKEAMEVTFYVPEDVRDFLKMNDVVKVESGAGEVKGRVSLIGTAVDPQKGLFQVQAQITTVTDKSLLSNTSVSLSLVTNSVQNEILIPFDAVYYDSDQAYVYVVKKEGTETRAARRDITPGVYNNSQIAVLEGLSDGEEVITTWGSGLKDGALIEIMGADSGSNEAQKTNP